MTTEQLKRSLGASVSMLISERRRVEDEILELEKRMTNTNISDEQVRALKANVDALEAEAAEKRALLARAETQARTLERDRAAARETAEREATAACRARVADLLSQKLALVEQAERLAREQLAVRREILRVNGEARSEALRLTSRAYGLLNDSELVGRMSLREAKTMSELAGCRHRYGHLTLPSGSFGLVPGLGWSEDEERHHGDARALIEEAN